jgi:hypothetical protein
MPDDLDAIHRALTAIRDTGLCTDPRRLNTAWADLTGRARPPETAEPPAANMTLGPCAVCGTLHDRYGDYGQPLCPRCRTHPPDQENPA